MKKLSEKEIAKKAAEVFKDHETAEKVFVAEDGNVFLPANHADALTHSRRAKVELHEVANPAIKQEEQVTPEELKAKEAELQKREATLEAREKALAAKEAKAAEGK